MKNQEARMSGDPICHTVAAYNLSSASENRIHDDATARKFGFTGGLVPGVEVYAYMTSPAVRHFGREWLTSGAAEMRFQRPVYDGALATVTAQPDDAGTLLLQLESAGILCAKGSARLTATSAPAADPDPAPEASAFEIHPLPDPDSRPDASPQSLPVGRVLGTYQQVMEAEALTRYLADVREDNDLYASEEIVHPGWILRLANRALAENVKLGPWIHVGGHLRNYAPAHYGDRLQARARVARNYEHKGHLFVALDVLITRSDGTVLTAIDHIAIYRPRQVVEAA